MADHMRDVNINKSQLLALPAETVVYILSYLDFRSLLSCSCSCRRLRQLSQDDGLWKRICKCVFLVKTCKAELGWRSTFQDYFREYGQYLSCYSVIRKAWDQIEEYFLNKAGPEAPFLKSLNGPATEGIIESAERKIGNRLPVDLRCSLRIHNGQAVFRRESSFMNAWSIGGSHVKSEYLLDVMTLAEKYHDSGELRGCAALTYTVFSTFNASQMIVLAEDEGHTRGEVFYPILRREGYPQVDQFISAKSFTAWVTRLAQDLADDHHVWEQNALFMLYREPSCVAVTDNMFKVRVATCFMPEMSSAMPPHFVFMYYITMSMDEAAPRHCSCQLETRHWIITDEDGNEERVDGPGVVGEYPVMRPGAEYSWISYTSYSTTYGNMKGFFTMKNLQTGHLLDIECPCYHMKCLPYRLSDERKIRRRERKKRL